ncbi:MAG: hypothetical protein U0X20_07940 [Caldilineaceae bacterium]
MKPTGNRWYATQKIPRLDNKVAISKRSLAAAKRGLENAHKREQGRTISMFAEYADKDRFVDESPEARIIRHRTAHSKWLWHMRKRLAGQWLTARAYMRAEEPHRIKELTAGWRTSMYPGDPTSFIVCLRKHGVEMSPFRSDSDRHPFETGEFAFGMTD